MTTDDRRRAILECAARLFHHYGHSKTTVADIAREAQMGVGTFYLVFPSKEAIVEELSSTAHFRVLHAMREVAEARAYDSFGERLAGVLEMRVAKFQELARRRPARLRARPLQERPGQERARALPRRGSVVAAGNRGGCAQDRRARAGRREARRGARAARLRDALAAVALRAAAPTRRVAWRTRCVACCCSA